MTPTRTLDRHALVTALWLTAAFVAAVLFDYGFGAGGSWGVGTAFAALLAGFAGHVVVNSVYGTGFTPRELALGLVAFGGGLIVFLVAVLAVPGFGERHFAVVSLGLLALSVAVVFYMVTHYGLRRVFDAFDVIREFRSTDDGGKRP